MAGRKNNGVYTAEYKEIQSISMISLPKQQFASGSHIDLKEDPFWFSMPMERKKRAADQFHGEGGFDGEGRRA